MLGLIERKEPGIWNFLYVISDPKGPQKAGETKKNVWKSDKSWEPEKNWKFKN